ncbi:putative membrane protein [Sorangium cellulosum So ce56]|uniref:Membrane protein n=1 Tax=Sorangium cellulosum (strain So ce56) TaxID=448385 RepID=A9FTZ4_SORC5|nr:hypothetical protein [Sorangium cellulosum]CAN98580.1 putative membrane protein [Sorangium cellulosum So ce56]
MTDTEQADTDARPEPDPGSPPDAQADAEPRRPPKKRGKRRDEKAAPPPGDAAPARPRDPEIERLEEAFERGDYALVRAEAGRLAKEAERDEIRRAARALLRRIDPDPLAVVLLVAAMALLAFLALWYWSHGHAAP